MPGKEIATASENTLLLAFRIDLDKIRRRPGPRGVFAIEAGDVDRFARAAIPECIELARIAKHQASLALAVGQRDGLYVEFVSYVQIAAALQQPAGLAAGFIREHMARLPYQTRHQQAVNSEIG